MGQIVDEKEGIRENSRGLGEKRVKKEIKGRKDAIKIGIRKLCFYKIFIAVGL